jgi:hypothetical protein
LILSFIRFVNKFKKHIDFIILLCYNKKVETIKNFGGNKNEAYQNSRNSQPLRKRKEGRMRRMPDFLPVRLQDQLRYRKPEMRELQGKQVICPSVGSFSGAVL